MTVFLFSPNQSANAKDQWDFGLLADLFNNKLWDMGENWEVIQADNLPKTDRAIVVIPARHNADRLEVINEQLKNLSHVVLFLIGDEEADFNVDGLDHPSIHIWVQNPHPDKHDKYNRLGTGYPPQSQEILPTVEPNKVYDVFFSGQLTHKRRFEMWDSLLEYGLRHKSQLYGTKGFTQGLDHQTYYKYMAEAKACPAPSGAVIPDSFRAFEGLESMSMVIADEISPDKKINGYWDWLFDDIVPFYKIKEMDNVYGYIQEIVKNYPANVHQQTAWWLNWKREFAYKVVNQLKGVHDGGS